jgi:hypothetical protein
MQDIPVTDGLAARFVSDQVPLESVNALSTASMPKQDVELRQSIPVTGFVLSICVTEPQLVPPYVTSLPDESTTTQLLVLEQKTSSSVFPLSITVPNGQLLPVQIEASA